MKTGTLSLVGLLFSVLILGCTPKLAETTVQEPDQSEEVNDLGEEGFSPCKRFDNTDEGEQALNAHVIYRDFLRNNQYDEAFPYWERAYSYAPAADGKRNTHFVDGIRFYEHFISKETNEAKKNEYIDRIFDFYDEMLECYGEEGYIAGRKGFDLYYKYKDRATQDEIFALFRKSIDTDGLESHLFILNPFTDLLVRQFDAEKLPMEEAQKYAKMISERVEKGYKSGKNRNQWDIINEYTSQRLEAFEGVKGFYDCTYFSIKYFPDYEADRANCEVIGDVYGKLKWGGCADDHPSLIALNEARSKHCVKEPPPPSESKLAYQALRDGDFQQAIAKFQDAVDATDDNEKKANYLLLIAKIYYSHLKNFPQARRFALEAANYKANWGEPYLLVGRLYASSGPLCGPGRGWDSQIVVWPAIDKWNQAKRVDPSVTAEANKWIQRYEQYMPSREDVFQRTLQEGASFRVGCWIQENTTIRSAK